MEIRKDKVMKELRERFKDNIIILLKFTSKEEYADDVIKGELYMNTVQFYRDCEEQFKKRGLGDKFEVMQRLIFDTLNFTQHSLQEPSIKLNNVPVSYQYNEDSKMPMYCMMGITIDDFEIVDIRDNQAILKIKIDSMSTERLIEDFGEYLTVINYHKFLSKIINKSEADNIPLAYGRVEYCEENKERRVRTFIEGSTDRFFYKDLFFEYQKEFRVVIGKDIREDNRYKIGSLDGMATNLKTTQIVNLEFPVDLD